MKNEFGKLITELNPVVENVRFPDMVGFVIVGPLLKTAYPNEPVVAVEEAEYICP